MVIGWFQEVNKSGMLTRYSIFLSFFIEYLFVSIFVSVSSYCSQSNDIDTYYQYSKLSGI